MDRVAPRQAQKADEPAIFHLLQKNELPLLGLEDTFLWLVEDTEAKAVIGLEIHEGIGLLRSLAVSVQARRQGLGRSLSRWLVTEALRRGLSDLYLLTLTTEGFFRNLGFTSMTRHKAPQALHGSAEFQGACPESATLMHLSLSKPELSVRPAVAGDAFEIAAIYNEAILERNATLETELRTAEERVAWLQSQSRGPRHPVLVALKLAEVAGWLSLNAFNPREAYRRVADVSVYVSPSHRRQGIGKTLVKAALEEAGQLGYHKLVLTMFPWNQAAKRLYLSGGFREVGTYREQGLLDGRWVDTLIMERLL